MARTELRNIPRRAIVLDTETTGFTPASGHRICEIAAIELVDGCPTGRTLHSFVNPGRPVPRMASDVHGLTTAFLADKPRFRAVAGSIADFLGDPTTVIWAHNAPFDHRFLEFEMRSAGHPLAHRFECSLRLARRLPHGGHDCKLETLAALAGHGWGNRGAHSALEDTRALASVLSRLLWPLAIQTASRPGTSTPRRKTPGKVAGKDDGAASGVVSLLPAGFKALTPDSDPRIRRYDELALDGLLHARGRRWESAEETRLVEGFLARRLGIPELVAEHGRSPGALMLKLESLGVITPAHPYARRG